MSTESTIPMRPRVRPLVAGAVVLLCYILATTVRIPYYSISPGGALATAPLVRARSGETYPPKGTIFLSTVSQKQDTVLDALQGWLDPDVDVVKEAVLFPPSIPASKVNDFNLQLMAVSKQKAAAVAFEQLGYDVVKGTGAQFAEVVPSSPADGVLKPGQVISEVDGQPVRLDSDVRRLLGAHKPGDTTRVVADGVEHTFTLAANPADKTRPLLGIGGITTRDLRIDLPRQIDVASQDIGGPSAGLAFTLGILDVLTPGELTGGHKVAVTGTIDLDGSVGPIGGIAQKTVAVEDAGADVFIVPSDELAAARKKANKRLRVEGVRNVADALRILESLGGSPVQPERR